MDLLDLMLDHDSWATTQLLEVSDGMPDAQLDQPFDIGHQTLRETFAHMIFNLPYWTAFLEGRPGEDGYSTDSQPDDRSLAALRAHHERAHAEFARVARRLRDEQRLGETRTDDYDVRKSLGGTILMVLEHNVEHRPEAVHMLHRLGVPDVPEVDLGVWDYLIHNQG